MLLHADELFTGVSSTEGARLAFNAITLEHAEAIVKAAEITGVPVVLQLSHNAIKFHGRPDAIAAGFVSIAHQSSSPIVLHLDHVKDPGLAMRAKELGFSSVMFDGSELEFEENVVATREVAQWGASRRIWVEAELGEIGGKDGPHAPHVRTDPNEAEQFVGATGVDSLAVAVGSSHAMTDQTSVLDLDLISQIAARVDTPLVLHGSSGVPLKTLREAGKAGMRKINVGTALNVAFTGRLREWLDQNEGIDPRHYLAQAREAMTTVCAEYIEVVNR